MEKRSDASTSVTFRMGRANQPVTVMSYLTSNEDSYFPRLAGYG
jgi:hypothetical protein